MNDNVSKHPKAREKQGKDAEKELDRLMAQVWQRRIGRKRITPARIAVWSFLTFVTVGSISGAVWAVVSLIRWL